jgi:hypothetical protein
MPHFAGTNINSAFGQGVMFNSLNNTQIYGTATATAAATSTSATEGTNMLTYTIATTGLYRIASAFRVAVVNTDAGTMTWEAWASYNNGTAITSAKLGTGGPTNTTCSFKGAIGTDNYQEAIVWCVAGTNVVLTVKELKGAGAVESVAGTGKMDIHWSIMGLA